MNNNLLIKFNDIKQNVHIITCKLISKWSKYNHNNSNALSYNTSASVYRCFRSKKWVFFVCWRIRFGVCYIIFLLLIYYLPLLFSSWCYYNKSLDLNDTSYNDWYYYDISSNDEVKASVILVILVLSVCFDCCVRNKWKYVDFLLRFYSHEEKRREE